MIRLSAVAMLAASPAWAEPPVVLADTAPVHSLVAMVMDGVGEPALIVAPGTSPHDASLRPSEAQALALADAIIWTGESLLPWLGESVGALAPDARVLALLDSGGWEALSTQDRGHGDEHDHGNVDPHAWLDPTIAAAWLLSIAETLADADPANAATYRANAASAADRMASLGADVSARLAEHKGAQVAVGHDAYRYLARAGGLAEPLPIAAADGADPSPADVAALREAVVAGDVRCLLLDAESDPSWADTLGEGAALATAMVDPDGVSLEPGPDLYPELIEGLVDALSDCLKE